MRRAIALGMAGCLLAWVGCQGKSAPSVAPGTAGPLVGTWKIVRFEDDAKDRLERLGVKPAGEGEAVPAARLVFHATECYVLRGDGRRERKAGLANAAFATYTLHDGASPATLDLVGFSEAEGSPAKTYPGIFKLEGNTLTLVYNEEGAERPTEFVSNAAWNLLVCQRESVTPESEESASP